MRKARNIRIGPPATSAAPIRGGAPGRYRSHGAAARADLCFELAERRETL